MKGDMTHMNFIKKLLGMEYFVPLVGVKDVADDQYMISSAGRIKRLYSNKSSKESVSFLKGSLNAGGKRVVTLGKSTYLVGSLMLYAFGKADSPRVKYKVRDNDNSNLTLSNLEVM